MSLPASVPHRPSPPLRPGNRVRRRRALISLTPLIDVVFILLVFFMLASSFLDWRAIELSTPADAVTGGGMEGALLVEVRGEDLRLSGETLDLAALEARIGERLLARPDQRVLVKPATGVPLQRVVEILDSLTLAGAGDISLIRDPGR